LRQAPEDAAELVTAALKRAEGQCRGQVGQEKEEEMSQRPPRCCARALPEPRCNPRLLCRALRLRWKGTPQVSGARAGLRPRRDPSDQTLDDTQQLVQG